MPKITFPGKDKKWVPNYLGEFYGHIINSSNIRLNSRQGFISLSPKGVPYTTSDDVANMTKGTGMVYSNYDNVASTYKHVTVCEKVYKTSGSGAQFAADSLTGSPTSLSDDEIVVHGKTAAGSDILVVSKGTNLNRFNYELSSTTWVTNWWTGLQKTITSSTDATPIVVLTSGAHGYSSGDKVVIRNHATNINANGDWTITVTDSTHFSLDGSTATGGGAGSGGTVNRTFDTSNTLYYLGQLPLNSVAHPMISFGNSPFLIIGDKNLLHSINTPGTAALPASDVDVRNSRVIFKPDYTINWIRTANDKIYVGLKNDRGDNFPSIVAEYDILNEVVREIRIEEGTTIGFVSNGNIHIIDIKGQLREYSGSTFNPYAFFPYAFFTGSSITLPHRNGIAVSDKNIYLLINDSSFRISAGVWIYEKELQRLYEYTSFSQSKTSLKDFGAGTFNSTGVLFSLSGTDILFAGLSMDKFYAGAQIAGIFVVGTSSNDFSGDTTPRGRFVTSKLNSEEIDNFWRNILVKYSGYQITGGAYTGSIVVKYRSTDKVNSAIGFLGTWASSTTFTVVSALTNISVGDEVNIWSGQGSNATAHIVSITGSSTKTVTIDEAILASPSGDFSFTVENWKKLTPSITSNSKGYELIDLPETSNDWIQFKIELRAGFEIEELQFGFQINLPVER